MVKPNSPEVIQRMKEEITVKYPVKKDLANKTGLTQPQITGLTTNGKYSAENRQKLVAAGLDMDFVETGVRKVVEQKPEYTSNVAAFELSVYHLPRFPCQKLRLTAGRCGGVFDKNLTKKRRKAFLPCAVRIGDTLPNATYSCCLHITSTVIGVAVVYVTASRAVKNP